MKNKNAFSLIELSIVLIIIGLLVAGVIGGKSLVMSARKRAFMNEVNNWKQSVFIFRAAVDRFPGDLKGTGIIGDPDQTFDSTSFPAPYNGTTYAIADSCTAPFIDMYIEGVSDFQPKNTSTNSGCFFASTPVANSFPYSKAFKQGYFAFRKRDATSYINYPSNGNPSALYFVIPSSNLTMDFVKTYIDMDRKFDDGLFNMGTMRAHCAYLAGWL